MTDSRTAENEVAAKMAERPKLYYRVKFTHLPAVVLEPDELTEFLADAEGAPTGVEKVYLTDAEYEALPEFES